LAADSLHSTAAPQFSLYSAIISA